MMNVEKMKAIILNYWSSERPVMQVSLDQAVEWVNRHHALLVFPIKNENEPLSLWKLFYPRTKMRWEWSDDGDDRVVKMWNLMKRLSEDRRVVYTKWYQGRATFLSRELFVELLRNSMNESPLSSTSKRLLDILEMDSPLSTKELKLMAELRGRDLEPEYNRGIRELFQRFLIVACGEKDDGAFPSLLIGATHWIYEDLWNEAQKPKAQSKVENLLSSNSKIYEFYLRSKSKR